MAYINIKLAIKTNYKLLFGLDKAKGNLEFIKQHPDSKEQNAQLLSDAIFYIEDHKKELEKYLGDK